MRSPFDPVNVPPEHWMELAACAGSPVEFFPRTGESTREANALCQGCPVRDDCLQYALGHSLDWGIWGGMGRKARVQLRRQLKRDAA